MLTWSCDSKATTSKGDARCCARALAGLVAGLVLAAPALAWVYTYEAVVAPSSISWERIVAGTPERRLENGWLIETLEYGDRDFYRYQLGGISSLLVDRFFVEWRAVTDNPEWLIDEYQVPTVVVAGGNGPAFYHVVMTESAAALFRDVKFPLLVVPVSVGDPHTYRIEAYANEYVWYIDGMVVDSGLSQGPYPDPTARLT
jgi:hypothetical protein